MYYECKSNAFSLFYVRLAIKKSLIKAFLTIQVIFWNKKLLLRHNIASHPKKFTAISFRTSAQGSALQVLAVITIHRLSNYYRTKVSHPQKFPIK